MSYKGREINADALFHLVMRRWRTLALVPLLTVAVAGAVWSVVPATYQSKTKLIIRDRHSPNPLLKDLVAVWSSKQRMPLIESILKSHDTSERVLRKLGRLDDSAPPKQVNEAVVGFQSGLEVISLGGDLVLIKVKGGTPTEAYDATNVLVETFTDQLLRPQRESVRASAAFFEDQLRRLRGDSTTMESSIGERPEAGDPTLEGDQSIRRALALAEVRLASAERQIAISEEKLRQIPVIEDKERRTTSPAVRKLSTDLADARSELIELQHRLGEDHPRLSAAEDRVLWLREALREKRSRLIAANSEQSKAARPGKANVEPNETVRYQTLLLEFKEARAEVDLLRNRLLAEELSMNEEDNQVWTVEAPVKATTSLKPPLELLLAAGFIAGLILALLAIAFFSSFDDAIRGEEELATALGVPTIGRMPIGEM